MLKKDLENKVTDQLITLNVDFVYLQLRGERTGSDDIFASCVCWQQIVLCMLYGDFCAFFLTFFFPIIFGCTGSLLLCGLSSSCGKWGLLSCFAAQASHCGGFPCCRAQALGRVDLSSCDLQAQYLWRTSPGAPRHVGSSWIRDGAQVSYTGRRILHH